MNANLVVLLGYLLATSLIFSLLGLIFSSGGRLVSFSRGFVGALVVGLVGALVGGLLGRWDGASVGVFIGAFVGSFGGSSGSRRGMK